MAKDKSENLPINDCKLRHPQRLGTYNDFVEIEFPWIPAQPFVDPFLFRIKNKEESIRDVPLFIKGIFVTVSSYDCPR